MLKLAHITGYSSIINLLVKQSNVIFNILVIWHQFLQNTGFISLVTKFMLATMKQEMDAIVKNLYFKLLTSNITFSIIEKFSLKKIDNNIKVAKFFLHFLIQKAIDIK